MPHRLKRAIVFTILFIPFAVCESRAQTLSPAKASSEQSEPRVVLVELFTSEGCSSCPPADALLRQVEGRHTESGQLIVTLSEHVTYWNHLGWSDPFSSEIYTQRQYAYGQRFHIDGVYTPQMVINGEEQIVGSDSAGLLRAIRGEEKPPSLLVHINSVSAHDHALVIDFSVTGTAPRGGADLFAVIADDTDRSSVLHGENSGRMLSHVSVARSITRVAKLSDPTEQTIQIPLPATSQFSDNQGRHLVLFAQTAGLGRVLGVDAKPF
jgi:hypothetical protein